MRRSLYAMRASAADTPRAWRLLAEEERRSYFNERSDIATRQRARARKLLDDLPNDVFDELIHATGYSLEYPMDDEELMRTLNDARAMEEREDES